MAKVISMKEWARKKFGDELVDEICEQADRDLAEYANQFGDLFVRGFTKKERDEMCICLVAALNDYKDHK